MNLDLTSLHYPPMAIASILHRISGIILFLLFPFMLYFFKWSLHSQTAYSALQIRLAQPVNKLLLWTFAAALTYHLLAGIRHLLMDIGFGESLGAGRLSAIIVIALSVVSAIFLGIWLW